MFWRILEAEKIKHRHSPVWLVFFILPLIPAVMGTFNYWVNQDILTNQWYDLWTQHTLFSCYFFLPVLLGIYCAWLWQLEHQQNNWNLMLTAPIPVSYVYGAKLVMTAVVLLLLQVWIGVLFFLAGKLCGLTAIFPVFTVINWLTCGWLGGMVVCTLQLLLSLFIRSFSLPVGIALLGGLLSLAATAKGWGAYFPYGLFAIGMRANTASSILSCGTTPFLFFTISYLLLFCLLSLLYMSQTDMAAHE